MASAGPYATADVDDRVLRVRLNRPDRLNAVSDELYADLEAVLERAAAAGDEVGAVLLTGEGRAFCAGADLKAHASGRRTAAQRRAYVWAGQRVCRLLQTMDKPVVAAVHGYAIGAGAEIALSADVVICAQDAQLRFPEIGLGTFVGGGVTARLPALVGQARAKHLLLLGRPLSGTEAEAWGLVARAVPADELATESAALAGDLAELPRTSLRLVKTALTRAETASTDEALAFEAEALLACMDTSDWDSGVRSFSSERPAPGGTP